jgi:hypothetical protein
VNSSMLTIKRKPVGHWPSCRGGRDDLNGSQGTSTAEHEAFAERYGLQRNYWLYIMLCFESVVHMQLSI